MKHPPKSPHLALSALSDQQWFTNPDADLRPVTQPVRIPSKDTSNSFLVTAATFPRLHKDFAALQQQSGGPPYALVITDILPNDVVADVDFNEHILRVRLSAVAGKPYTDILYLLSHELGHVWRNIHPEVASALVRPLIAKRMGEELEADLLGICFTQDKQGALAWNARGGHGQSKDYPNKAILKREIIALAWKDCPSDSPAAPAAAIPHASPDARLPQNIKPIR